MKPIFEKVNEMQAAGIIGKYAIGGAVGATFYLEPSATLDVDIFAALPMQSGHALISLGPIYDYLQSRGGKLEGEHIVVDGWPVNSCLRLTRSTKRHCSRLLKRRSRG